LVAKYNRAELSGEEQLELNDWINLSAANASLFAELTDQAATRSHVQKMDSYDEAAIRAKIESHYPYAFIQQPKPRRIWYRVAAAAAVLVLLGSGIYFYYTNSGQHKTETKNQLAVQDIAAPKNNRATITLANGQKVFLDSAAKGTLAVQGNIKVEKLGDGKIAYNGDTQPKITIEYNTLTNPRGSKVINITLSDGSRVWLNAESSLKYPVAFAGKERIVEIGGEAYFEVRHDPAKPFKVKAGNTLVEDIGTKFNINAYPDENAERITLLEGAIEVGAASAGTKTANSRRLAPNEQALMQAGQVTLNTHPDLEEVMAWKNGLFDFHNADIKAIMQQLSRWYDVQVSYEGKTTDETYNGEIGRTLSLKDVMEGLAFTHVKYRIEEGRKLVILP